MKANKNRIVSIIILFCILAGTGASAQVIGKKRKIQIQIKSTDSLVYSQNRGEDIRRLYGHVQFEQNGTLMSCDSAYFYAKANLFDAFSNVHIVRGDSLNLYGDTLYFDGNTQFAKIRGKVMLRDRATTLTTRFLDYDMKNSVGFYHSGGHIVSSVNTLDSRIGKYFEKTSEFVFRDQVKLNNPDYVIQSDTLRYNTRTATAYFYGPTTIVSKENFIYCENGWYDTKRNISQFRKNSYLNNGPKYLYGDSIYYDRNKSVGKAFGNIRIKDTVQNTVIFGNYAYYREKPEYIEVTDSMMLVQVMQSDSLFIHGDSLTSYFDTSGTYRLIKVFNKVRIFKSDLQGKCDSLVYNFRDSTLEMHTRPVIWSAQHQISGNRIDLHVQHNQLDRVYIRGASFMVSQRDSIRYDQVKGTNMTGYIRDRELYRLDVTRNGETIYYLSDEVTLEPLGVNKSECENITVLLKGSELQEIIFRKSPKGTMYPPEFLPREDLFFRDFKWQDNIRPRDKSDIFRWRE